MYESKGSLKFKKRQLLLDGKPFRIMSGAVHYFRILPQYWKSTLLKMKACGLNTVETYVPWNLHEAVPGQFDFEGVHDTLHIKKFIELAYEVGLYVILRPGPYICSEWDFGGLPSWLLRDPDMKVRSNYHGYQKAVRNYFSRLIPYIAPLQYSKGKNIIAVQIENEFGAYSEEIEHLAFLKSLLIKYGIEEMLFISDNKRGIARTKFYHDSLPTANFGNLKSGIDIFNYIKILSPDFPLIIMELWDGWFDHWGEKRHLGLSGEALEEALKVILKAGANINFYMFQGGTNFGFMNGANWFEERGYEPDITSYDYNSPISEYGEMTEKFMMILKLLRQHDVDMHQDPLPMEYLELQTNSRQCGQSYGFILYRKYLPRVGKLVIHGTVNDRMQVFWNGREVAVFDWKTQKYEVDFSKLNVYVTSNNTLDLLVENLGRVNFVRFGANRLNEERKGIIGTVMVDGKEAKNWLTYSLEFKTQFLNRVWNNENYKPLSSIARAPALYSTEFIIQGEPEDTFLSMEVCLCVWFVCMSVHIEHYSTEFNIQGEPEDTFLSMEGWTKGVVFINDFNIGRYWEIGPQKTLYVPAAILKQKTNTVSIATDNKAS
ncbi:hypothetical protein FSP39_015857 [Pinctada imbricata]|uniref:Beta-galactosidase n=1 Tax=Pinctada imbricata TaxID=66713 RepID=A0AA88YKP5_PINIB|nr:hypothetical protein FSP39_015857 [Pinctada imbricata]